MNDAALHLTEQVFPEVPVRQWVCSLPFQLRYLLGYDRQLCAAVLRAFAVELSASYRRRAKREHGLQSVSMLHTGSVTFVQRVDSALRLNVHAHVLALDGVYLRQGSRNAPEALSWLPLPEPTAADVQQLTERTAARVERVLRSHGRYLDDEHHDDGTGDADTLAHDQPALAACYQASASGRALLGAQAGKPPLRVLGASPSAKPGLGLCAQVRGVNIHASAAVPARDRPRLERLCRYAARPPLSQERLSELPDGRLRLELKRPWSDGTTAVLLSPDDLIARLCAAVPPPRFHLIRFHGVVASHSALRSLVVPKTRPEVTTGDQTQVQLPLFATEPASPPAAEPATQTERRYKGRHPWAVLLRHVFAVDVERCAHCAGRMRLIELCATAEALDRVLHHAGPGPPPRAPPTSPRPHPTQLCLPLHAG